MTDPLAVLALIVMGITLLAMLIIPVLPGQFLIWGIAVIYALATDWQNLGWGTFIILTLGMLVAAIVDLLAGWWGAKRGGASKRGIFIGFVVGFIGLFILNAIGSLVGIFAGIVGYEYLQDQDWKRAFKAGGGYLLGLLASLVVRLIIALLMVASFYMKIS